MTDIFFSYSSKDRARVERAHSALTERGFDVFWDLDVPATTTWNQWIKGRLDQSRCVIVFWTQNSAASPNVLHEVAIAREDGNLIQVLLEPLGTRDLPMGVVAEQAVKLMDWRGETSDPEWLKLLAAVEERATPRWLRTKVSELDIRLKAEQQKLGEADARVRALEEAHARAVAAQGDLRRQKDRLKAERDELLKRKLPSKIATGAAAVAALMAGLAAGPSVQTALGLKRPNAEQQVALDAAQTAKERAEERAAKAEVTASTAAGAQKQAEANYDAALGERDRALAAKVKAENAANVLAVKLKEAQTGREASEARIAALTAKLEGSEKQLAEAAERDAANAKAKLMKLLSAEAALNPGQSFKECVNCPEMVVVPAGSFTMGSPESEPERTGDEGPQHEVTFAKPFAVGKFTVTFDEWKACADDGGCQSHPLPDDHGWGKGKRPVIDVSWDDAQSYVDWINRKLHLKDREGSAGSYRLLSETEWEYVARAGRQTIFWWGSQFKPRMANCDGCGSEFDNKKTAPAGSFPANEFGLYDMAGNVAQWTQDCWRDTYVDTPDDGSASGGEKSCYRVCRGGAWSSYPRSIRSAFRYKKAPGTRDDKTGFRVAKTLISRN